MEYAELKAYYEGAREDMVDTMMKYGLEQHSQSRPVVRSFMQAFDNATERALDLESGEDLRSDGTVCELVTFWVRNLMDRVLVLTEKEIATIYRLWLLKRGYQNWPMNHEKRVDVFIGSADGLDAVCESKDLDLIYKITKDVQ